MKGFLLRDTTGSAGDGITYPLLKDKEVSFQPQSSIIESTKLDVKYLDIDFRDVKACDVAATEPETLEDTIFAMGIQKEIEQQGKIVMVEYPGTEKNTYYFFPDEDPSVVETNITRQVFAPLARQIAVATSAKVFVFSIDGGVCSLLRMKADGKSVKWKRFWTSEKPNNLWMVTGDES